MTPDQQKQIQQDAERAAHMGWTPNQMCPHPFSSEQGRYWTNCYWAMRERLQGALPEPDSLAGAYQQERRGK